MGLENNIKNINNNKNILKETQIAIKKWKFLHFVS